MYNNAMKQAELQQGLQQAIEFLGASQGTDGGWGYGIGKQSYPEPTCYALLALTSSEPASEPSQARRRTDFARRPP